MRKNNGGILLFVVEKLKHLRHCRAFCFWQLIPNSICVRLAMAKSEVRTACRQNKCTVVIIVEIIE